MFTTKMALRLSAAAMALAVALPAAAAPVQIDWWYSNGGKIEEAIQGLISDFNASQSDYEIVGTRKGNYEETLAATIASYRVGQNPVILQAAERGFMTMLNANVAVPMHQLMEDNGHKLDWDDFIAPVASFFKVDGKVYAMPFNSSTPVIYYNQDLFAKAGLDAPADTYQGLDKQLHQLKDAGVGCGMVLANDYYWSMLENFSTIGDYPWATKANGFGGYDTEYVFNTTPVVDQVTRIKSWIDDGILKFAGQGMLPEQLFTNGECATYIASTGAHGTMDGISGFKWSADFLPGDEGREMRNSSIGGGSLWVMANKTPEQIKGAADFIAYIGTPEKQAWWSEKTGYVPITNAAYEKMKADGFFEKHPTREIAIQQLTRGTPTDNSQGFRFGNGNESVAYLLEEMQAVWIGKKTPQEGLDAAVTRGNQVLRGYEDLYGAK